MPRVPGPSQSLSSSVVIYISSVPVTWASAWSLLLPILDPYCFNNLAGEYSTHHPALFLDSGGAGLGSLGSVFPEVIDRWWLPGFQKRKPLLTSLLPCLLYFSIPRIGLGGGEAKNLLIQGQAIWSSEGMGNYLSSVHCAVGVVKIVSILGAVSFSLIRSFL